MNNIYGIYKRSKKGFELIKQTEDLKEVKNIISQEDYKECIVINHIVERNEDTPFLCGSYKEVNVEFDNKVNEEYELNGVMFQIKEKEKGKEK